MEPVKKAEVADAIRRLPDTERRWCNHHALGVEPDVITKEQLESGECDGYSFQRRALAEQVWR